MMRPNKFPKNILAALDALAELGKATQSKAQIPQPADPHIVDGKVKKPKLKKAKNKTDKRRK